MVDVRMGSKYVSSVNDQMAYFMKWTFRKSGPLEKRTPDLYKYWTLCQNSLYWSKKALSQIRGRWSQI